MIDGVFIGLSTIDVVYKVKNFPSPNTKVNALSQDVFVGGPATNAAIAFCCLGGKAALVSAVGRHSIAHGIREELSKYGIEFTDLCPEFDGTPAISSVAVDDLGRRNVISANAARIPIPTAKVDERICRQAKVVLVDGHAMEACMVWARAAKALGKTVVLDGGSWKDGTDELLKYVHTAICSGDFRAPGCSLEPDLVEYLRASGVQNVAITHGAEPIVYVTQSQEGQIPVPAVDAIDTTGAGDILHGAYCYFFSSGKGFEEALTLAAHIASESCRYGGTREWMRGFDAGHSPRVG